MHSRATNIYNLRISGKIMQELDQAASELKTFNPLLERLNKLPGTTIRLPSKGLFYVNGELDAECKDGEIQLSPMTTTDELMMRSTDMLFQGTAIDNVLKRCSPQIKKPLELFVADIDYILTQLRKISYGSHIPINYECDCVTDEAEKKKMKEAGDTEYLIPIENLIQHTKELDPKNFNKQFNVKLTNGQHVILQPLRFIDFIKIQQMEDPSLLKDIENVKEYVAANFTSVTKSVDEITDKEMIKEWYKALPRLDAERIKNKLNKMDSWGIEFKHSITCRKCKKEKEITSHLNPVYFFMLPSSPETNSD